MSLVLYICYQFALHVTILYLSSLALAQLLKSAKKYLLYCIPPKIKLPVKTFAASELRGNCVKTGLGGLLGISMQSNYNLDSAQTEHAVGVRIKYRDISQAKGNAPVCFNKRPRIHKVRDNMKIFNTAIFSKTQNRDSLINKTHFNT